MYRTLMPALAGLVVFAGAEAGAVGVPSKKGDPGKDTAVKDAAGKDAAGPKDAAKDAAAEPSASVALEAELPPNQHARLIKPIEAKLSAAAEAVKAYAKEQTKPVGRRNARLLLACKQRAATYYLGAALAARKAVNRLREDRLKQAVREQYQRPNEQKAVDIYLQLAEKARDEGHVREAVGYYKRILKIKGDHARAKEALAEIEKEPRQKPRTGSTNPGGGSDDEPGDGGRDVGTGGKHPDGRSVG